jgi:hypothetical protein
MTINEELKSDGFQLDGEFIYWREATDAQLCNYAKVAHPSDLQRDFMEALLKLCHEKRRVTNK